jgi:hypothetical protein
MAKRESFVMLMHSFILSLFKKTHLVAIALAEESSICLECTKDREMMDGFNSFSRVKSSILFCWTRSVKSFWISSSGKQPSGNSGRYSTYSAQVAMHKSVKDFTTVTLLYFLVISSSVSSRYSDLDLSKC